MNPRVFLASALLLLPAAGLAQVPAPPTPVAASSGALIGPALFVADRARALRFYVDGLGMKVNVTMGPPARQETILGFDGDPAKPGIILLSDATASTPPVIEHGHGFNRLVLRMASLDATGERLRSAGFSPAPIREVAMGYRMMLVADADGYQLELVERHSPQR